MGILKDAISAAYKAETGKDLQWLNTKPQVIETAAQAKYNDVRRVERDYTHGFTHIDENPDYQPTTNK